MKCRWITKESCHELLQNNSEIFLLANIRAKSSLIKQINILENLASAAPYDLRVCIIQDDFEFFAQRFDFHGSPTFILLKGGTEISRFMGMADFEGLEKFLNDNLCGQTTEG